MFERLPGNFTFGTVDVLANISRSVDVTIVNRIGSFTYTSILYIHILYLNVKHRID